ncbi:MAG TPA: sugar phosphate nucleotidyltransferase [bacterium]|nr:sugar phosphate nucleotidyltransferase [bacterium]
MDHAVILAGGHGERFWPLSRRQRPKQLLPILGDQSLLETTIERIKPDFPAERTWVVTSEEIGHAVQERVTYLPKENVLMEPRGCNTALAIGWAAVEIARRDPEATLVVLSADHAIEPAAMLRRILREGIRLAKAENNLVIIGINPSRPETGYGYIELGPHFASADGINSYQVETFREKPDRTTAQDYYYGRRHLWNAGIFVWTVKTLLEALEKHCPGVYQPLAQYRKSGRDRQALAKLYETAERIPIDVAVLERASNVVAIKADLAWDDVGSWLALSRLRKADVDNNVLVGRVVEMETFDTTVYNDTDDLICAFGVSDLVVVRTDKAILVAHKSRIDEIKRLMERLKSDPQWEPYL